MSFSKYTGVGGGTNGIPIYPNLAAFPAVANNGEQGVAADTDTIYIYNSTIPGWTAVATPPVGVFISSLTTDVTATGPGAAVATISNSAVTNAKMANMANNTVKANKSGGAAAPSDLALSDVAETVSSVLTITNGSKTVVSPSNLTIQVKQSSAVQDGYLSSTDWSTFNSKQPAGTYVTSVGATAPVASSGGTTPTISMPVATALADGYLSSADWSTFNSKQPAGSYITALTGQVTATGPGSAAATIATNTVSNSNLVQVASQTFKGRTTAGTGNVEDLSATQATAILNNFVGDSGSGGTKGLVPAPVAGDATKYLRGDATWQTVIAGVDTVGAFSGSSQANGATISGNTITFGPADATNPGMMSTGTQTIAGTKTFTGNVQNTNYILSPQLYDAGTFAGAISLNWADGPAQKFVINAAGPLAITLSNPVTGGTYLLRMEQGATPGTVTWPGSVNWGSTGAPVLSNATGEVDLISLFYDGTTYWGQAQIQDALPAANTSLTNLSFAGANGQVIELAGGVPTWQNKYPAQAGNQYKVLATSGSAASWQYAGLGDGTLPTNSVILGVNKPTNLGAGNLICGPGTASSISGTSNILIGVGNGNSGAGFTDSALSTGNNNILIGNQGNSITSGSLNIIIGTRATGNNVTASTAESIIIANQHYGSGTYCVQLGFGTRGATSSVVVGHTADASGNYSVGVGRSASCYASNYCVAIGALATARTSPANGYSTSVGYGAGAVDGNTSVGPNNVCLGAFAGSSQNNTTATRNIFLGYSAGRYNTNQADELFIDNQDRTTYAAQQTNSLVYGKFNATPSSQTFTLNAAVTSTYGFIANEIGGDFDTRIEGDTDANLLFVDAGTDRVGIGNNAPAVKLHTQATTAATNTVTNVLRVDSQSSGTPAAGIGVGIEMAAETGVGNTEIGVVLEAVTNDVTSTSEDFDFVVKTMSAGATAAERLKVGSDGTVTVANGDMVLNTAGNGLKIKTGTDATAGLATITNGNSEVTVTTNKCSATSIILVTNQTSTAAVCVTTKTSGSFKIAHVNNVSGDQECAWFIINPA